MSSDIGVCDKQTVSYSHRVYDAGGALQGILFPLNLGRLGNSVSLWLNIEPYELFFYVFLPPLLLDAAVKLDFFLFKKTVHSACHLANKHSLYTYKLYSGTPVTSALCNQQQVDHAAGGPHHLQVLLEGESLLNDATSITLFLVFLKEVQDLQSQTNPPKVGAHEFGVIVGNIIWLSVGGMLIGLAFGVTVRWLLSWMRQRDAGRDQQICLTLAVAYLSFYVANSPANVSGVIAVVTYGLYGAYTTNWDMDVHILESGAFDSFYESLAFLVNGIIFFYSGVSCVNFVVRSTEDLYLNSPISEAAAALWRLPLIYIVFNCIRFIVIFALRPLFKLLHRDLSTKEVVFASIAGLRGSVSLIMAQAFVTESSTTTPEARMIKAELVLWVAGFVLLSLIINAPMLPWIMRITRLNTVPEGKLRMRRKAVIALAAHKQEGLQQLKDDPDEMLRGVDWSLVAEHVSMDNAYEQFLDPEASQSQQQGWMQNFKGWVWSQKPLKEDRSAPQTPGTLTPHSHRGVPGQGYDPNASWSKASNSAAGSSVDASNMSSSSSGSSKSSGSNSAALSYQGTSFRGTVDEANLAAAVAAVAVAAEAAIEPDDAIDELPYLADTAVVDADATAMVDDQTEAEPNSAVAAVQAGIDTFAGAIKGLFGNKARSDPGLLEVSVVADGSASPRKDEEMEIPTGPQGKSLGTSSLRQKSKSEKRARLLLLANGLFMPMPVNQQQPAAANLQEDKQLIADSLKPVHASATPAKHTRKGSEAFVRFEAAPAAADTAEQSVMESQASVKVAVASSADALSAGNLRRASVTSKGSDAQVSVSALRSKSFSAGSKAPASSAEGRVSPTAASVSRESPFHKVARSQMSQHVERSSASATVHGSAGSVAAQLLDQLKGLRPGHSSQHDMHHPSTVTPHPHASAPSEAGSTFGQHGPSSHHGSEADDLAVADMRVRLLAGLKRYLHGKRLNGLLSSEGLRVLDNACETAAEHAAEHPEDPLDVWRLVERDCRGSWGVKLLARAVYQLHRLHQRLRRAVGPHPRLLWPLSRCIALGSQQLSKRLLLACEVAMELMLSLTYAHQVQWLQRHRPSHQLLTEVHEQSQKAWAFIIAREVEAPQRFQAIQSHRAAQAILHQQTQYVTHLLETAVVAEDDGRHLLRPIQQRERQLVDMGPTWRTPSVAGVLRNLPFMRHSPPQVLEVDPAPLT
ncbi:TPA: Son of sevenless 1, variant 2 [Trebouxia sp. C0004]